MLRRAITDQISAPVALFALLVVVSTIVWLRVYQVHSGEGWEYVVALAVFTVIGLPTPHPQSPLPLREEYFVNVLCVQSKYDLLSH